MQLSRLNPEHHALMSLPYLAEIALDIGAFELARTFCDILFDRKIQNMSDEDFAIRSRAAIESHIIMYKIITMVHKVRAAERLHEGVELQENMESIQVIIAVANRHASGCYCICNSICGM